MPTPIGVSFEFFPPQDVRSASALERTIEQLAPLSPAFVSVTCGAGGSVRSRTLDCVWRLQHGTNLVIAPHLTCIDAAPGEVESIAKIYWAHGIRHIVALRGDLTQPPQVPASVSPPGNRYKYASELVQALRKTESFEILVAAYPEGHPESGLSADADIENLRRKVDAGATRAITQFFFDPYAFLRYRDRVAASGLRIPIVPGILPILSFSQLTGFAQRCGATVPLWLLHRFDGLEADPDTRRMVAAHVVIDQVRRLREHGVDAFHFYTLNRPELTLAACHVLGVRPTKLQTNQVA